MERPQEILKFWQAIEHLSPQKLPNTKPDAQQRLTKVHKEDPFPWENPKFPQPGLGKVWNHSLFVGLVSTSQLVKGVKIQLGETNSYKETDSYEFALLGFEANQWGMPKQKTYICSSAPWALGRLHTLANRPDRDKNFFLGFESFARARAEDFEGKWFKYDPETKKYFCRGAAIDHQSLALELKWLESATGSSLVPEDPLLSALVWSRQVPNGRRPPEDPQDPGQGKFPAEEGKAPFLNSFFAEELGLLAVGAPLGGGMDCTSSEALGRYLGNGENRPRIDLRLDRAFAFKALAPGNFPGGRWPANPLQPLVYAQQLAVNLIFSQLGQKAGLFSVNGPPGTGKTTLLREVISGVIVERAKALCKFSSPDQAFYDKSRITLGEKYTYNSYKLDSSLLGFEMVVASSNNGAVENISKELPSSGALAQEFSVLPAADYFREVAQGLETDYWGLLSAPLGNAENRKKLATRLWFQTKQERSAKPLPPSADQDPRNDRPSLKEFLALPYDGEKEWPKAKNFFLSQLQAVETHLNALERLQTNERSQIALQAKLRETLGPLEECKTQLAQATGEQQRLEGEIPNLEQQERTSFLRLQGLLAVKPGFLSRWFHTQTWKSWAQRLEQVNEQLGADAEALRSGRRRFQEIATLLPQLTQARKQLDQERENLQNNLLQLQREASEAQRNLGGNLLDDRSLKRAESELQVLSPWAEKVFGELRSRLLLAALQLHKSFVLSNRGVFTSNLGLLFNTLADRTDPRMFGEQIRHLWATFFLVIPVVSTTFASFPRNFEGMDKESLGWLLIDEAGQALPQAAVGALWRARRAVVIGDPKQLEPVQTVPKELLQTLGQYFEVGRNWYPDECSAQSLADQVNPFGTWINGAGGKEWVGCPLRAHRRCQEPMFSVANQIAYANQMVNLTAPDPAEPELPPSAWADSQPNDFSGHWSPNQGEICLDLIKTLLQGGLPLEEMAVISPFKDVVQGMSNLLYQQQLGRIKCGTVHTFQGKESQVVILLLGGDPSRPGALQWAASKPNLLNVAVTRAKRRIYVIGDLRHWGALPYFQDLAALLAQ